MKKLAAALLTVAAAAISPIVVAPVADADICAGARGRHVGVGGCTNVAGDVATGVAIAPSLGREPVRPWRGAVLHGRGCSVLHATWRSLLKRASNNRHFVVVHTGYGDDGSGRNRQGWQE